MRSQPATLALIMVNVAMLVFIFYALVKAGEFRETMLHQQFAYQREVTQLLAKCVVPGG